MAIKEKKYRINELLNLLSVDRNAKAIRFLPVMLDISQATFNNYRNIGIDDAGYPSYHCNEAGTVF